MSSSDSKPSSWALVTIIIVIVIGLFLSWKFFLSDSDMDKAPETINEPVVIEAPLVEEPNINEPTDDDINNSIIEESITKTPPVEVIEPEVDTVIEIPVLNESDLWVKEKLSAIIWRKELLELLIDEDMIRRFVVFVDNFSQGNIAYSHSPFIKPSTSFTGKKVALEGEVQKWEFDESTFKRFSLYVDLFRSVNSETLVEWYKELHPLIKQAYSELGYPDQDFDQVLQVAITKVLDLEFPKENKELVRPSVMYRYKSAEIEALDDADKLMLRIGKDNLLIIKSVLLEINEKLNKTE
ncbi:DUF3014 domain-containing protein [Colwellia sp. RE-S-Sl-9]